MSTPDHDEVQKKIDASASFYDSFLNVDYRLADYCLQTITPYFTGSHCLEIGPANGMMTIKLVNLFRQVDVAEASETLLNKIPAHPNLRKYHTRIENFNPGYRYDTIIMSHVLEHIKEPLSALKAVKNLLAPGGRFIVSVPNAKSVHRLVAVKMGMLASEYELNERDHALGHYRVYDTVLLRKHLEDAGFAVLHQGGYFLKPLSNAQMEAFFTPAMLDGFYAVSEHFPQHCAEIFAVCAAP